MKIGLAGLGLMGAAIARRLFDTGHFHTVYNRHYIKTGLSKQGVAVATTPKELAQDCDFILISVTNFAAEVERVSRKSHRLLKRSQKQCSI